MKTLVISSSPHKEKSMTFMLAKEVMRGLAQAGVQTEVIHLADQHIGFCRHCEECHKKILSCSIKDSVEGILKKMLESDGIILASPNYINQVTASMKALFDRSVHFIHCKRLLGKYIVGVVSSGSGQDQAVLDYLKYYGHTCGAQYSGGISCPAYSVKEKLPQAFALGKKMYRDMQEKTAFADQLKSIEEGRKHFQRVMEIRKEEWREEYAYWQREGWL
jgi:multimeric flavodoxin WrbA